MFHKRMLDRILAEDAVVTSAVPGEAPGEVAVEPVITEPTNNPEEANGFNIYDLYPDLIDVDVTSPCTLVDYFQSLCDSEIENQEFETQAKFVPSMKSQDTPEEFA